MIRDRKHETMPREKLQQLQGERLAALVARLYSSVPLYKERMDEAGLDPKAVKGLEDIQKLPFTYKTDLRDTYPFGMFAKPLKEIVRIHASSGTTGKPTTVGYTRGDIDTWAEVMARTLAGAMTSAQVSISPRVYPTVVGLPVVPEEACILTISFSGFANIPCLLYTSDAPHD